MKRASARLVAVALGVMMSLTPIPAGASSPRVTALVAPPLARGGQVDTSSCVTGPVCVSIGWNHHGNHTYLWAARWQNGRWTPVSLPRSVLDGNDQSLLVQCVDADWCMVTGSRDPLMPGPRSGPVAALLTGTRWTRVAFPSVPRSWADLPVQLSCVSSSWCMSVGTYAANRPHLIDATYLVADVWNGTHWRQVAISSPHNGAPLTDPGMVAGGEHPTAIPASLSCVTSHFCVIVGTFAGDYTEIWNGSNWTSKNALDRADYPAGNSSLWGGACVSTTFCLAGGGYWISGSTSRPTIERFDGRAWRNMSLPPLPAMYARYQGFTVSRIRCATLTFCVALVDAAHARTPANALKWDGEAWRYLGVGPLTSITRVCESARDCVEF